VCVPLLSMRATCSTHLTVPVFGEEYKLWRSSICNWQEGWWHVMRGWHVFGTGEQRFGRTGPIVSRIEFLMGR
jgi:hypothetical protein